MPAAKETRLKSNALANFGPDLIDEVIVSSKGSYLYTENGREILDWTSGQMCSLLGHCHPEITSTLQSTSQSLDHLSSYMLSQPIIDLAEHLTSLLPPGLDKVTFYSTGSESNEAALRLAKLHTRGFEVVALGQSWHGMTCQTQASQFFAGRKGCGPPIPGSFMLPQPNARESPFRHPDGSHDWETELAHGWEMIDQQSCGSLAACIVEIIQGDAGIHPLPPGYLLALKRECELRGMLLIVDEAQTGFGRTGELFAIDGEAVIPDILTLSKPFANGMPLSAVVTSEEIDTDCKEKDFLFFTSHTNDPLMAAIGGKTLEIVLRDRLAVNARERGEQLMRGLRRLQERYSYIVDVRGRGLLIGLEIGDGRTGGLDCLEVANELAREMWKSGIWCQLTHQAVFRIGPPINSTPEQIDDGLRILGSIFSEVDRQLRGPFP